MRQAAVAIGTAVAAAAALLTAPVLAQTGAQAGTPIQPGGWGAGGWQAGGATPAYPTPVATPSGAAPAYAPPPRPAVTSAYASPPGYGSAASYASPYSADSYRRRPLERGQKLKGAWKSPVYTVHDWQRFGLPAPGPGMRWSRYHDDAVLVDRRDRVVDARGNIDWSGPSRRAVAAVAPPPVYPAPTVRRSVARVGDSIVTTETRTETVAPSVDLAAYGPGATFTPGTRTTVTTTTETAPPRAGGRGAWARRR